MGCFQKELYALTHHKSDSLNSDSSSGPLFWQQLICGERTAVVYVCCYQQGWHTSCLRLNGVSNAVALGICKEWGKEEHQRDQIRSAHWSTQEKQSMGTHQGVLASSCIGNLLIKLDWWEKAQNILSFPLKKWNRKKIMEKLIDYLWSKWLIRCGASTSVSIWH